jgi:hypothetical protein
MTYFRLFSIVAAVFIAAGLTVNVSLADKEKGKKEAEHHEYSKEQMAAWQEAISPGSHHKQLKHLVGEWDTKVTTWDGPGTEGTTSQGKAKCEMVLGGRFVVQHMTGEMMGMPFEGMGIVGYDNATKQHTSVWMDNMGTQMMYTEGSCENHCKMETHHGSFPGPSGQEMKFRMLTNIIDEKKHTMEMYLVGEDGKEFKHMEVVYTRS